MKARYGFVVGVIAAVAVMWPGDAFGQGVRRLGGGLSEAVADALYLKLDASNGPLTADLTFDGKIISSVGTGINAIEFLTNGARLKIGTGATDYLSSDGTNINFAGTVAVLGGLTVLGINVSAGTTDIRVNLFNSGGDVFINDGLKLAGDIFDSRTSTAVTVSDVDGFDVSAGPLTVSGVSTLTGDLTLDSGVLRLQETTTPSAVPDEGAIYTTSANLLKFVDGAGVDHTVSLTETFHAEATDANNDDEFGVSAALNYECYHSNDSGGVDGFVAGDLQGFTFDAGGAGTSFPIASIADGGGGEIAVTTTGSHGLAVGDIVSQANLTDAAYESVFVVNTITSATVYEVTATFTATDTGTLNQCASLIASTGSAGDYLVMWSASATSSTNNENFDMRIYIEAAPQFDTEVREKFGTSGDFETIGKQAIITIADGDNVSFALENRNTAGDITIRYFTIVLMRL